MCSKFLMERQTEGTGEFMKGNEPQPIRMPVIAVQCECGTWFVRPTYGGLWVQAEKAA